MSLFVDTSAPLAFLDADQPWHTDVIDAWEGAIVEERRLFISCGRDIRPPVEMIAGAFAGHRLDTCGAGLCSIRSSRSRV